MASVTNLTLVMVAACKGSHFIMDLDMQTEVIVGHAYHAIASYPSVSF